MPKLSYDIDPNHELEIPRPTKSRDTRLIDACILYIYGDPQNGKRVTKCDDLALITGAGSKTIQTTKIGDKWEEFRMSLVKQQLEKRQGGELAWFQRRRSPEEIKLIEDEKRRQREEIPKLEAQAELILMRMKEDPPGSKLYPGLVTALDRVTKMLDDRTGKGQEEKEVAELQRALVKFAAEKASKPKEEDKIRDVVAEVLPE